MCHLVAEFFKIDALSCSCFQSRWHAIMCHSYTRASWNHFQEFANYFFWSHSSFFSVSSLELFFWLPAAPLLSWARKLELYLFSHFSCVLPAIVIILWAYIQQEKWEEKKATGACSTLTGLDLLWFLRKLTLPHWVPLSHHCCCCVHCHHQLHWIA